MEFIHQNSEIFNSLAVRIPWKKSIILEKHTDYQSLKSKPIIINSYVWRATGRTEVHNQHQPHVDVYRYEKLELLMKLSTQLLYI